MKRIKINTVNIAISQIVLVTTKMIDLKLIHVHFIMTSIYMYNNTDLIIPVVEST